MAEVTLYFPKGFKWGCATSPYQTEGENTNSDWWAWEQGEGHIAGGQKSGKSCDWWGDGFLTDLEWMARLNNNAQRLGVEWSRIEPKEGAFDDAALERYRFMLKSLRERGIEPLVTLHHFSNPIWIAERGGWETPEILPLFERYVTKVVERLKDLCDFWITINEPMIHAALGYLQAAGDGVRHQTTFPPGKNDLKLMLNVVENMLLGHAGAYHTLHRLQPEARVGIAHNMAYLEPANPRSPFDRFFTGVHERLVNRGMAEAVLYGRIPRLVGSRRVRALRNSVDFIGLDYYTRELVKFDRQAADSGFSRRLQNRAGEMSDGNYGEVYPRGLYHLLRRLGRYGKPLYITENGIPDHDDDRRPAFLINHLKQVWHAINENVPVLGYYHWTLTDNFEWAEGWNLRFGLIELDPETCTRTLRKSGELYAEICQANLLNTDMVSRYAPELMETVFKG
ncbi:MAG TPA: glycoside hydrolase family 1 protein [Anaerolineae bacterium]|nr:glycoside hydrolase family 1 protein [Anaerolineae bacterium]